MNLPSALAQEFNLQEHRFPLASRAGGGSLEAAAREKIISFATLMRSAGWSSSNRAIRQTWSTRLLPDMFKQQAEALDHFLQHV
jgi:hypothetical protein